MVCDSKGVAEALKGKDDLNVTVLYNAKGEVVTSQRFGRTLLYQRNALPGQVVNYEYNAGEDFTVVLDTGQRIHYWEFPNVKNADELAAALGGMPSGSEIWVMSGLREALVVDKDWRSLVAPLKSVLKPLKKSIRFTWVYVRI